jgi:hypothetical protein
MKEVFNAQVKHSPLSTNGFEISLDEKPFVCKAFYVIPLPDGTYDVFVVDAIEDPNDDAVQLELALTRGPDKGEVVRLRARHLRRDAVSLLGLPGTLTVTDGAPSLALD